jgi:hypothetical protein
MTLSEWVENNFTNIELSPELKQMKASNGSVISRMPSRIDLELTAALLSCSNIDEFKRVAFHLAPVGIIVDDLQEDFYKDMLLLLKTELTKILLQPGSNKALAMRYLDILERRDSANWAKGKDTHIEVKNDSATSDLSINFITVG